MSDPVTNVEIEDVLSSIRKLVAEESRATGPARRRERPERLVLTPAQRVRDEDVTPAKPAAPVLLTQPIPSALPKADRSLDAIPGNARLSQFGAVEGAFPDADKADRTSETSGAKQPEEEIVAPRRDLSWLVEEEVAAALGLTGNGDDPEPDQIADFTEMAEESHGTDHDSVATRPKSGDRPDRAEVTKDGHPEPTFKHRRNVADERLERREDETSDSDTFEHRVSSSAPEFVEERAQSQEAEPYPEPESPEPPQTLEDKVAALGRLVAGNAQEFEEERDQPDADDLAAATEPMTWADAAPFVEVEEETAQGSNVLHAEKAWPQHRTADPVAETGIEQRAEATKRTEATLPESPTHLPVEPVEDAPFEIDEQILRELVGDIVRQELQGALGERITRNVRKLVRREIHRMLISQDFD